jgi:transposase
VTHNYVRHGTTTLFAAPNTATGEVIAQCKPRHRHQEFLAFLKHVDLAVPVDLDEHLIVDNYATHKHPKVRAWLARHTRYHMHFTPTCSGWLNQVERWLGLFTQQAIRRGSSRNVRQLVTSIERYVELYNQHDRPFVWTATADFNSPESGSAMQYFWDRILEPRRSRAGRFHRASRLGGPVAGLRMSR